MIRNWMMRIVDRKESGGGGTVKMAEKNKKTVRHGMLKVLAGFFAVMLIFTVVSRVTASLTVAQVMVESPSEKKIEHVITAIGSVEKNRELAVLTEPGILVKTVYVKEGQKVTAGEVLAELDIEQLKEQILAAEDEIRVLKFTNEALADNRKQAEQDRQTTLNRAKEDSKQALMDAERQLEWAAEELQRAKDGYESYEAANMGRDITEEIFAQTVALKENAEAKQKVYEAVLQAYQDAQKNVERAEEDARRPPETDYSEEINNIQIAEKERKLEGLKELEQRRGQILAPVESVVTEVYLQTGQKTTDTAAVTLADISSGMRYAAHIETADAKYVSVGDEVTLEKNGKKLSGLAVDTVETNEDGSIEITVLLPTGKTQEGKEAEETDGKMFSIGDSAELELRKTSTSSRSSIPLTALHMENAKYYVFVLETEDTVLGEQYFVRRVDVVVKDKNQTYAALEEGTLTSDSQVVTDSDRYVEAGSRVRLWE